MLVLSGCILENYFKVKNKLCSFLLVFSQSRVECCQQLMNLLNKIVKIKVLTQNLAKSITLLKMLLICVNKILMLMTW